MLGPNCGNRSTIHHHRRPVHVAHLPQTPHQKRRTKNPTPKCRFCRQKCSAGDRRDRRPTVAQPQTPYRRCDEWLIGNRARELQRGTDDRILSVNPMALIHTPPPSPDRKRVMSEIHTEEKSLTEQLTEGSDVPTGHKAPGSPFILVGLGYLIVLLFAVLVMAIVYWSYAGDADPAGGDVSAQHGQPQRWAANPMQLTS